MPGFGHGAGTRLQENIMMLDHIRALVKTFGEETCANGCIPASLFDQVRAISQDNEDVPTRSRGEKDGQDHSTPLKLARKWDADANEKICQ